MLRCGLETLLFGIVRFCSLMLRLQAERFAHPRRLGTVDTRAVWILRSTGVFSSFMNRRGAARARPRRCERRQRPRSQLYRHPGETGTRKGYWCLNLSHVGPNFFGPTFERRRTKTRAILSIIGPNFSCLGTSRPRSHKFSLIQNFHVQASLQTCLNLWQHG